MLGCKQNGKGGKTRSRPIASAEFEHVHCQLVKGMDALQRADEEFEFSRDRTSEIPAQFIRTVGNLSNPGVGDKSRFFFRYPFHLVNFESKVLP